LRFVVRSTSKISMPRLVGGAPLNEQFAASVGADGYCRDASVAVETAKGFMAKRQGSLVALAAGS
jgi:methanogenic corrinoid protein MtbC1